MSKYELDDYNGQIGWATSTIHYLEELKHRTSDIIDNYSRQLEFALEQGGLFLNYHDALAGNPLDNMKRDVRNIHEAADRYIDMLREHIQHLKDLEPEDGPE